MTVDRLVVGCGYLGRRVARRWQDEGVSVAALTRSETTAASFRDDGLIPVVGDVTDRGSLDRLPAAEVLLVTVGFDRSAGPSKREVYVDGLRNLLDATRERTGRIIYVSSTSVYGVSDGSDVNDETVAEPSSEAGRICLDAERLCFDAEIIKSPATVLRLGGIYGPDRLLRRVGQLKDREPIAGRADAWLNLTHVDDAATAVIAAATHPSPRPTYLVTDDEPVRRVDYYGRLAEIVGTPPPVFDDAASPRHASGLGKRCVGEAVTRDLVPTWQFPTFREGLADAVKRSKDL